MKYDLKVNFSLFQIHWDQHLENRIPNALKGPCPALPGRTRPYPASPQDYVAKLPGDRRRRDPAALVPGPLPLVEGAQRLGVPPRPISREPKAPEVGRPALGDGPTPVVNLPRLFLPDFRPA